MDCLRNCAFTGAAGHTFNGIGDFPRILSSARPGHCRQFRYIYKAYLLAQIVDDRGELRSIGISSSEINDRALRRHFATTSLRSRF